MHAKGFRNVYSPYVEAIDHRNEKGNIDYNTELSQKKRFSSKWRKLLANDPYLNHNFSMVGAHLNIK